MKGFTQIYTGNGKGKTTCALGLAFRASGYGMHTYIGQFMKNQYCGELKAIEDNQFITIERFGDKCFLHKKEVNQQHIDLALSGFKRCQTALHSGKYRIVILDEINVAIWFGLIKVEQVINLMDSIPDNIELILTGRNAPKELIAKADLVSEIKEVKHYYQNGVKARKGIEF